MPFSAPLRVALLVVNGVFASGGALAQSPESIYTQLDNDCAVVDQPAPDHPASWIQLRCEGHDGHPVHVSDEDGRMSLKYGHDEHGPWEGFSSFNHAGDTVEWRLRDGVPFATIHRRFVDDDAGDRDHEVLVISTVAWRDGKRKSCMIGLVDARANADANALAREVADTRAADFRCGTDRVRYLGVTTGSTPSLDWAFD